MAKENYKLTSIDIKQDTHGMWGIVPVFGSSYSPPPWIAMYRFKTSQEAERAMFDILNNLSDIKATITEPKTREIPLK